MHKIISVPLLKWTVWLAAIFGCQTASRATTVAIPVHIWVEGNVSKGLSVSGTFLESAPGTNDGYATVTQQGSGQITADLGEVSAEPGRGYQVMIGGGGALSGGAINVVPPPGFYAEIERIVRNRYTTGYGAVVVRILPRPALPPRPASSDVSEATGKIDWRVSLGSLQNGTSAGEIALIDAGFMSDWTAIYTPALLDYEAPSTEVKVYRDSGWIRQVVANETVVDVVTLSSTAYEIKFYHPIQKLGEIAPYTFQGQPYAVYKLERDGPGGATKLKITRSSYNILNATDTGILPARVEVMSIERSGTAWPNYDWIHNAWTTGAQTLVQRTIDSGGTTIARTETAVLRVPGGDTATSASRNFAVKPWGEVITSEKLGSGTTNIPTADFVYYEDVNQPGSYSYLKSATTGGGNWEAYEYFDTTAATSKRAGTIKYRFQPYLDLPSAANVIQGSGEITEFDYVADAFGFLTRPSLKQTTVNGTLTARKTTSYTETTVNGMIVVAATHRDYSDATNYLESVALSYKENLADTFFRGQIHSTLQPGGIKTVYAHQRGSWNGSIFTAAGGTGLGAGTASRETVIVGSSVLSAGTPYGTHDGYDIDDVYLVDGKSTMQVTIRDDRALVVRTETHAFSGNAWRLVGFTDYTYNFVGQLKKRVTSNGGVYDATYDGRQLTSETDESGVVVSYGYDVTGRVLTATKTSGPITTYVYDAAGRVRVTTVSAVGIDETIVTKQQFDDAGRVIETKPAGLTVTNISYDVTARSQKVTAPDGGTTIQTVFRDGRPKQTTGSAVVSQYFTYGLESDGRRFTQVNSGTLDSPRLQKSWTDWLGRAIKSERPGFSQSSQGAQVEEQLYEPGTGRLYKTTRTGGYAPTRYEYDALGSIVRSGLDLNDNGLELASADRISDSDTVIEFDTGTGTSWVKTTTKTYPTLNFDTPLTTSISSTRLTGHQANRLSETQTTDAEGNIVTTVTDVNRSTKTVTTTTTMPGLANSQISTVVNGLSTSVKGNDGLTTTREYDALTRSWKTTDSRLNATITAYYANSGLVRSITDGAGNAVSTVGYDNNGRVVWSQDAGLHVTRSAYNPRGQVKNQWGDATIPVSSDYNAYGERTGISTYRGAPPLDYENWPESTVGIADTTNWFFDAATGQLWKKTSADGGNGVKTVEFDYNQRGQIATRKWARKLVSSPTTPVTTSYVYDPSTGELTNVNYNDDAETLVTPDVTYSYNRLGQTKTVRDHTGLRNFVYDAAKPWRLANETFSSDFGSLSFTRRYEATGVLGRYAGFKLGTLPDNSSSVLEQDYNYTPSGRFDKLTSQRAANNVTNAFQYSYDDNAPLVTGYHTGVNFEITRVYEDKCNVLKSLDSTWSGTSLAKFEFKTNALYQRKTAKQSGTAFADYYATGYTSVFNHYTYNARGELETAAMYRGNTVPEVDAVPASVSELPGRRFEYRYDSAGNRKNAGPTGDPLLGDEKYTTNALNQYKEKENNTVRVTGTADVDATVDVAGANVAAKKDRAWVADLMPANESAAASGTVTLYAALAGRGPAGKDLIKVDTSKSYFVPKAAQTFNYDDDGNLTTDSVWDYSYDAENRLVAMQHRSDVIGPGKILAVNARRLEFKYDYLGRRVAKIVKKGWNGSTYLDMHSYSKFLYDGWNLVAEYSGATNVALGTLARTYTWGLDLAGSLTATGGVGALLQVYDAGTGKTYLPTYDGNGNVVSMVNANSGAFEAIYEYSPFGELIRNEGAYAAVNPFRFSTKYTDLETGLSYYGHRYYSAALGRFINRDPIEESGGINLYGFCKNNAVNSIDLLGHSWLSDFLDGLSGSRMWENFGAAIMRFLFDRSSSTTYGAGMRLGAEPVVMAPVTASRGDYSGNTATNTNPDAFNGLLNPLDTTLLGSARDAPGNSHGSSGGSLGGSSSGPSSVQPTDLTNSVYQDTTPANPNMGNLMPLSNSTASEWRDDAERDRAIGLNNTSFQDEQARERWHLAEVNGPESEDFKFLPDGTTETRWQAAVKQDMLDFGKASLSVVLFELAPEIRLARIGRGIEAAESADAMSIRFTQPTVSQNFSTGQTLTETANALRSGELAAADLPTIRVVEQNGSLFTLDNRRLVAFQQAGLSEIPIQRVSLSDPAIMKEFLRKFNPVNGGQNIVVTPNAAGQGAAEAVLIQYGKIK